MGTNRYLTRLALGRSPYEPLPPPGSESELEPTASSSPISGPGGTQQYDSRGRPINPETRAREEAIRKAQNELLVLVGVLKRIDEDQENPHDESHYRALSEARQAVLSREDELGRTLARLVPPINHSLHAWIAAFVGRVQIGAYDLHQPVCSILSREWQRLRHAPSAAHPELTFYPGALARLLHHTLRALLTGAITQLTGRLQLLSAVALPSRRSRNATFLLLSLSTRAAHFAIDLLLLPLELHALLQSLGLAAPVTHDRSLATIPFLPLLPPLSFPRAYSRLLATPSLPLPSPWNTLSTPASLLLLSHLLRPSRGPDLFPPSAPKESHLTHLLSPFRYPPLTSPSPPPPSLLSDPWGWTAYQSWRLRANLLASAGWDLEGPPSRPRDASAQTTTTTTPTTASALETDLVPAGVVSSAETTATGGGARFRSTALARLPVEVLASGVDAAVARPGGWVWEGVVLRAIAGVYVSSGARGRVEEGGTAVGGGVYRVLGLGTGRWAWGRVWGDFGEVGGWGRYLNVLGVAFAMHCVGDAVVFAGVYGLVRAVGTGRFGWGKKGEIGGVKFSERAEREGS